MYVCQSSCSQSVHFFIPLLVDCLRGPVEGPGVALLMAVRNMISRG